MSQEVVKWLQNILGPDAKPTNSNELSVLLCQSVNKLKPNTIIKIERENAEKNLKNFLIACRKLGLRKHSLFTPKMIIVEGDYTTLSKVLVALSNSLSDFRKFPSLVPPLPETVQINQLYHESNSGWVGALDEKAQEFRSNNLVNSNTDVEEGESKFLQKRGISRFTQPRGSNEGNNFNEEQSPTNILSNSPRREELIIQSFGRGRASFDVLLISTEGSYFQSTIVLTKKQMKLIIIGRQLHLFEYQNASIFWLARCPDLLKILIGSNEITQENSQMSYDQFLLKFINLESQYQFWKLFELFQIYSGKNIENYLILGNILGKKYEKEAIVLRSLTKGYIHFECIIKQILPQYNKFQAIFEKIQLVKKKMGKKRKKNQIEKKNQFHGIFQINNYHISLIPILGNNINKITNRNKNKKENNIFNQNFTNNNNTNNNNNDINNNNSNNNNNNSSSNNNNNNNNDDDDDDINISFDWQNEIYSIYKIKKKKKNLKSYSLLLKIDRPYNSMVYKLKFLTKLKCSLCYSIFKRFQIKNWKIDENLLKSSQAKNNFQPKPSQNVYWLDRWLDSQIGIANFAYTGDPIIIQQQPIDQFTFFKNKLITQSRSSSSISSSSNPTGGIKNQIEKLIKEEDFSVRFPIKILLTDGGKKSKHRQTKKIKLFKNGMIVLTSVFFEILVFKKPIFTCKYKSSHMIFIHPLNPKIFMIRIDNSRSLIFLTKTLPMRDLIVNLFNSCLHKSINGHFTKLPITLTGSSDTMKFSKNIKQFIKKTYSINNFISQEYNFIPKSNFQLKDKKSNKKKKENNEEDRDEEGERLGEENEYYIAIFHSFGDRVGKANIKLFQNYFQIMINELNILRYYNIYSKLFFESNNSLICKFNIDENSTIFIGFCNHEQKIAFLTNFRKNRSRFLKDKIKLKYKIKCNLIIKEKINKNKSNRNKNKNRNFHLKKVATNIEIWSDHFSIETNFEKFSSEYSTQSIRKGALNSNTSQKYLRLYIWSDRYFEIEFRTPLIREEFIKNFEKNLKKYLLNKNNLKELLINNNNIEKKKLFIFKPTFYYVSNPKKIITKNGKIIILKEGLIFKQTINMNNNNGYNNNNNNNNNDNNGNNNNNKDNEDDDYQKTNRIKKIVKKYRTPKNLMIRPNKKIADILEISLGTNEIFLISFPNKQTIIKFLTKIEKKLNYWISNIDSIYELSHKLSIENFYKNLLYWVDHHSTFKIQCKQYPNIDNHSNNNFLIHALITFIHDEIFFITTNGSTIRTNIDKLIIYKNDYQDQIIQFYFLDLHEIWFCKFLNKSIQYNFIYQYSSKINWLKNYNGLPNSLNSNSDLPNAPNPKSNSHQKSIKVTKSLESSTLNSQLFDNIQLNQFDFKLFLNNKKNDFWVTFFNESGVFSGNGLIRFVDIEKEIHIMNEKIERIFIINNTFQIFWHPKVFGIIKIIFEKNSLVVGLKTEKQKEILLGKLNQFNSKINLKFNPNKNVFKKRRVLNNSLNSDPQIRNNAIGKEKNAELDMGIGEGKEIRKGKKREGSMIENSEEIEKGKAKDEIEEFFINFIDDNSNIQENGKLVFNLTKNLLIFKTPKETKTENIEIQSRILVHPKNRSMVKISFNDKKKPKILQLNSSKRTKRLCELFKQTHLKHTRQYKIMVIDKKEKEGEKESLIGGIIFIKKNGFKINIPKKNETFEKNYNQINLTTSSKKLKKIKFSFNNKKISFYVKSEKEKENLIRIWRRKNNKSTKNIASTKQSSKHIKKKENDENENKKKNNDKKEKEKENENENEKEKNNIKKEKGEEKENIKKEKGKEKENADNNDENENKERNEKKRKGNSNEDTRDKEEIKNKENLKKNNAKETNSETKKLKINDLKDNEKIENVKKTLNSNQDIQIFDILIYKSSNPQIQKNTKSKVFFKDDTIMLEYNQKNTELPIQNIISKRHIKKPKYVQISQPKEFLYILKFNDPDQSKTFMNIFAEKYANYIN
ncbi:eukaryotic translation initiation factor 4 gamma [Anaeramoeba flamelloides]|uniref:Eukaryotic translation initiation factor 4 gamma n=1 Tax=Anaeramoeba flamelloides TaxID=1746091 RepID=A0ABQ8Z8M5_9EUKA|nr:eukaryotic translation initiation factor 4 gamma [Anaeramoeba flamelloides]